MFRSWAEEYAGIVRWSGGTVARNDQGPITMLFGGGVAQAATPGPAWAGPCEIFLNIEPGTLVGQTNSHDYAQAQVFQSNNSSGGGLCEGYLMRSTDGGASWGRIGDYHWTSGPGTSDATGFYYDGPGYMSKACVVDEGTVSNCTDAY
jgi:hypothetical protein